MTAVDVDTATRLLLLQALTANVHAGDLSVDQLLDYVESRRWNPDRAAAEDALTALTLREFFHDDPIAALHTVEYVEYGVGLDALYNRCDTLREDAHQDYLYNLAILAVDTP